MNTEALSILILGMLTIVIYFLIRRAARYQLNMYGLVLLWPIVLAIINGWTTVITMVCVVLALIGIGLIVIKSKRCDDEKE